MSNSNRFFDYKTELLVREKMQSEGNTLPPEVLQLMYNERLFKLFVPDVLNGRMTDLPKALKIFEDASRIDGSFGWLVTIGSGGGYFSSFFEKPVSQNLFSPENAVVAGSGYPSGIAKKASGGYLVNGEWKYCSGAAYATMFTANCRMEDDSIRSFIFMPGQVQIIPTWNAFGLKATGSDTIKVKDAFVPAEMTFYTDTSQRNYYDSIFYFPFLQFAECSFAAVCIGIARHFMEEVLQLVEANKSRWETTEPKRSRFIQKLLQKHISILETSSKIFYESIENCWGQIAGSLKTAEPQSLEKITEASKNISAQTVQNAQEILPYLGMNVLMEDNPLNRCYRDLHTASQHVLLKKFPHGS